MERPRAEGGLLEADDAPRGDAESALETPPTTGSDYCPLPSVLSWYVIGAVAAVAIGFIAARLHQWGIAPVGLISIGAGVVQGMIVGWVAAWCRRTCRKRLLLGTFAMALVTVLAEHAWLYADFRRQWHEARAQSPEVALFRPETPWSPAEYFAREASAGRVALWIVDAGLIAAAALVTAAITRRVIDKPRVASDAAK